jgi:hypothetical protein
MLFRETGSCAAHIINHINTHKDATTALKNFCESQLGKGSGFTSSYMQLYSFYVFTAGPQKDAYRKASGRWVRYGKDFAALIRKEKLGKVATLGEYPNLKVYGPNHMCQAWLWHPYQKALEAWWENNKSDVHQRG